MSQNKSSNVFSTLISQIESTALQVIDLNTNVAIEALEQTQKVLDHAEILARRLVDIKSRMDRFSKDSEIAFKEQAIHTCHDFTEVGIEFVKSIGVIAQASLGEIKEFGYSSGHFIKETLDSAKDLSEPFHKNNISHSRNATIIPISIQDN